MTDRTVDEQMSEISAGLLVAVDHAIGPWAQRCVLVTCSDAGVASDTRIRAAAADAAARCRTEVVAALGLLLRSDIDEQDRTPLQVVRTGVRYPTGVLVAFGVAPVQRDEFERRSFPEDLYRLTPAGFGDIDPSLTEPAIAWGAAKAHVHLSRRRSAGR